MAETGLPCSYPGCDSVSHVGTLEELSQDGWVIFGTFGRKPLAFCPLCPPTESNIRPGLDFREPPA